MSDQPPASVRARAAELLRELDSAINDLGKSPDWRDTLPEQPEKFAPLEQAVSALRKLP